MPTYDYECADCGTRHKIQHAMSAPAPECPSCSGTLAKILITAPAVSGVNGGSGFSSEPAACDMPGGGCATGACPFA
ncbi:MAG: zinc ribbon domain-containing protein [Hyphomicrobiales bacterium]|nr:MAG: zinc ribbon domain-containing protein [Hyphomicrobiales bacterium]